MIQFKHVYSNNGIIASDVTEITSSRALPTRHWQPLEAEPPIEGFIIWRLFHQEYYYGLENFWIPILRLLGQREWGGAWKDKTWRVVMRITTKIIWKWHCSFFGIFLLITFQSVVYLIKTILIVSMCLSLLTQKMQVFGVISWFCHFSKKVFPFSNLI